MAFRLDKGDDVLGVRLLLRQIGKRDIGAFALAAIRRLDEQTHLLEKTATGPSFEHFVAGERAASPTYGGRSV